MIFAMNMLTSAATYHRSAAPVEIDLGTVC